MNKTPTSIYRKAKHASQRGASAILIVIFATILLSLISVSFIGLMLNESSRSTDDEQSQGAYDAALAGIEDGKRVLLECLQGSGTSKTNACNAINGSPSACIPFSEGGVVDPSGQPEVAVSSFSSGSDDLNLAYTCVVVEPSTPDYLGVLNDNDSSAVIPLRSVSGFSYVEIYWFDRNDADVPDVPSTAAAELPTLGGSWSAERPPLLRVQMMQYESGDLSGADFDSDAYSHTLYLYPSQIGTTSLDFGVDSRRSGTSTPRLVVCSNASYPVSGYSCYARLTMPNIAGSLADRRAYLRLTSLYNGANYRIVLRNSTDDVVNFDNVQPSIDSTGRANDLFRRIETRVGVVSDIPYPRATVDINSSFCKTFSVGATAGDYDAGACNPDN